MAEITVKFLRNTYPSLQVGDTGYYADEDILSTVAGFNSTGSNQESLLIEIGTIKSIDNTTTLTDGTLTTTVVFNALPSVTPPNDKDFVLFSKDNKVNCSSLLGYYAEVKFKNNSSDKAEMAAAACEISESSK